MMDNFYKVTHIPTTTTSTIYTAFLTEPKFPAAIRLTKDLGRAILLAEDAREQAEEAAKKVADESTSAATGGPKGQLPDGEDPEEERKTNCSKSESPVWKELKPFRGSLKTDGDKIYEWDRLHNDIEIYNSRGQHLGSLDPQTGLKIKDAVAGRTIKL